MVVGTLSARPENRAVGMGLFYSMVLRRRRSCAGDVRLGGRHVGRSGGCAAGRRGSLGAGSAIMPHRRLTAHELMLARA